MTLINDLKKEFCNYFDISFEELISKSRKRVITEKRQLFAYILYNHITSNYSEIARLLKHKQHATIINACSTISNLVETDKEMLTHYLYFKKFIEDYIELDIKEEIKKELLNYLLKYHKKFSKINKELVKLGIK